MLGRTGARLLRERARDCDAMGWGQRGVYCRMTGGRGHGQTHPSLFLGGMGRADDDLVCVVTGEWAARLSRDQASSLGGKTTSAAGSANSSRKQPKKETKNTVDAAASEDGMAKVEDQGGREGVEA